MITVRRATQADKEPVWRVHAAAIRESCKTHYTQEEIESWAGPLKPEVYARGISTQDFFVAEESRVIVGFGQLDRKKGEIEAVYVRPSYQGRGAGTKILQALEEAAQKHGLRSVHLSSSLNAAGFYERAGYRRGQDVTHLLQSGTEIPCVHMSKELKQ